MNEADRPSEYHTPDLVDDTRYDVDPYTETTVAVPHHEEYFDDPEMAYASMSISFPLGLCRRCLRPHERELILDAAGTSPATGQYSKSAQSRNSYASPGLSPYHPHSPGMSEGSSYQASGSVDQASSQRSVNRNSKIPRQLPLPGQQNQVRQETDAGRVALVPPSYDPTWAQESPAEVTVNRDEDSPAPVSPVAPIDDVHVKK